MEAEFYSDVWKTIRKEEWCWSVGTIPDFPL
jgi:hypothetical protein